ncbi:hypothetical protein [Bilifractor porci]|nr:hypothetical protein [Bilifractor porci]
MNILEEYSFHAQAAAPVSEKRILAATFFLPVVCILAERSLFA